MSAPPFLDDLQRRLGELIRNSPARDLERNARAMVSSAVARLDLVPREEFEIQAKVLARTRERLEQLERRVTELEARAAGAEKPPA